MNSQQAINFINVHYQFARLETNKYGDCNNTLISYVREG